MQGTGGRAKGPGWLCVVLASAVLPVSGQQIDLGSVTPRVGKQHVALLTDSVEVKAGVPQTVELQFKVDAGFHINSHVPKDELMIPTVVKVEGEGLRVADAAYPAGKAFRLEIGEGETLDVYEGEFRVGLHVVARKGASTLTGVLRYQACDRAACFPPRTLPVTVAVVGK